MLTLEAQLRSSPEIQTQYQAVEAAGDDEMTWMEVTSKLQRDVCEQFGFGHGGAASLEVALGELRAAAPRHQDICLWQRLVQNKAKRGDLRKGEAIPNVTLHYLSPDDADGSNITDGNNDGAVALRDLTPADGRPLGVIALSYS